MKPEKKEHFILPRIILSEAELLASNRVFSCTPKSHFC